MLSLNDFKTIGLEDKPVFEKQYTRFPPAHSGELFTTMVSWSGYVECRYAFVDNSIIIRSKDKDNIVLHQPIGKFDLKLFKQVATLAVKEDATFGFIKTPEKNLLSKQIPSLQFIEDRDFFDYVYSTKDLAELPGTRYAKIRNRLNKFTKSTAYTIEEITIKNMDEVSEFLKRWCLWKDCASDELLENERKAIVFCMAHFFELGLSGIALRINNSIEAIAVCEKMNPDTLVVHFEKGSPDYDGIYKAINQETAKRYQDTIPFIDREEDAGVAGLRQAKLSYHPHHFAEISHITQESLPSLSIH